MRSWDEVIDRVLRLPKHKDIKVPKSKVIHPLKEGFRRSIGEPSGQLADYRLTLADNKSIHIREYNKYYLVHWDAVDPEVDFIGHLINDASHWLIALAALALIGVYITGGGIVKKALSMII